MMNVESRITVVIPVFNRPELVKRAVASILQQSEASSIIVVDDGSDPALQAFGPLAHPTVTIFRQVNAGGGAARNRGVQFAKTEFVTFLDSDDEAEPGWLAALLSEFVDASVAAVCCGIVQVREGRVVGNVLPSDLGRPFWGVRGLFTQGGTYALRRDIFLECGGFDEKMPASQHTEFALRLTDYCRRGKLQIRSIERALIRYNIHGGPSIRTNDEAVFRAATRLLEKHGPAIRLSPSYARDTLATGGVRAIRAGKTKEGRELLLRAVLAKPTWRGVLRLVGATSPGLARRIWPPTLKVGVKSQPSQHPNDDT